MAYSLDTSSFLDAWLRYYPPDVFPGIWDQMDSAARSGVVFASDEVVRELKKKDDGAYDWIKARPEMIIDFDSEIERHLREIMDRYPRLVDTKKGRSIGDPFVLAVARSRGLTVITSEYASGKLDVPKIPDVCVDLGLRWIRILEFFREQKWSFLR